MSIIYSVTVRTNRLQQVINAIDAGAGNGVLRIGTTGMGSILSSVVLSKPSATATAGVLTFNNLPLADPTAALSGVAAAARIEDSAGTVVASGLTVGLPGSGSDIITNQTTITQGQIVSFIAGTIVGN